MLWRLFSRIDSRRSLRSLLLVVAIAGLSQPVPAQLTHNAVYRPERTFLEITVQAAGADLAVLQQNLDAGLTARVEFAIRVLEPRVGVWRVFGDRGIREYVTGSEARWDLFTQRYVIRSDDGTRFSFASVDELTRFLFSLQQYRIPWIGMTDRRGTVAEHVVLETQVRYSPVVFVPALAILAFFRVEERLVSPWVRSPVIEVPR